MSKKALFNKEKLQQYSLGPKEKRVAILGAFDTWTLMHNVASILAKNGYVAVTSRFIYAKNEHHYNEIEWCSKFGKKTLGIALVREIFKEGMCPDCVVNHKYNYSYCIGEENAWACMKKPDCPF